MKKIVKGYDDRGNPIWGNDEPKKEEPKREPKQVEARKIIGTATKPKSRTTKKKTKTTKKKK